MNTPETQSGGSLKPVGSAFERHVWIPVHKRTGRAPAAALPQAEPAASRELVNRVLADFRKSLEAPAKA